jgi:soluble lytic murein transglycosylase
MEAAIYAESIPFNETRDYVKKVMSNASYYSQQFGQTVISLKERIGVIAPRARVAEKPAAEPGG